MKTQRKTVTQGQRRLAAAVPCPPGWAKEVVDGQLYERTGPPWAGDAGYGRPVVSVRLTAPADVGVVLIFRVAREQHWGKGKPTWKTGYDGTTHFHVPARNVWLSFDRTGVESSFHAPYGPADATGADAQAVIDEQVRRAAEYRARTAGHVEIPGTGYRAAPETIEQYRAALKAGRSFSLTPSGFGTGRRFTARRPNHPYAASAKPETAAFFGFDTLWVETFDHD